MNRKSIAEHVAFSAEKMQKVNLFETPKFFCDLYCLQPGQDQKIHSHADNDKLYLVQRGRAKVTVGDTDHDVGEGEIVFAPAGEPHGVINESSADLVCVVFMAPHPSLKG